MKNTFKINAILGVISLFLIIASCTPTPEPKNEHPKDIFSTYYQKPIVPELPKHEPILMEIKQGLQQYSDGNYQVAITQLEETAKDTPQKYQSMLRLYWGICQLELGKTQEALTYLNQVDPNSESGAQAFWYRGLTHLKAQQMDAAKSVFRQIAANNTSSYQQSAKAILKEMK